MSRCFPFPPPGYVPKARTGIIDLPTKEKLREKHKKEKRDKEKRDKDRSKDKLKEKKDQKHKDRKKEKDRDNGRTSEDSKAGQAQRHHNDLHIEENLQKIDEVKVSKFQEELAKMARDDGASNPMVGKFTNFIQRKFEGVGDAAILLEKERAADSKVFSVQSASVRRRNDSSFLPIEDVAISPQIRAECISHATAMEKERIKMHEKVTVGRDIAESRNHGIFRSMEIVSVPPVRKTEGSTGEMENQKCGERSLVSNSVVVPKPERGKPGSKISALSSLASAQRRKDVLGISVESISSIQAKTEAHSRIVAMDSVPKIKKEREIHQKVVGKNRTQGNQTEDRKLLKNSNRTVKKSMVQNAEDIEHNKLINFAKKDQVNTLNNKPLAPHKDNAIGILRADDGTEKKRKCLDTNGYLRENGRPVKIPSMTSSSQSLVNGRSLELHLSSPSTIPLQRSAMNNSRPDRLLENKERKINGNQISQLPSEPPLELKPPASGSLTKNSDVSLVLLPHPDSKYLHEIYAVPKMVESPEIDRQEWLFSHHDSLQKSKTELEAADRVPLVFAEALRIESADVLALPYVVPF